MQLCVLFICVNLLKPKIMILKESMLKPKDIGENDIKIQIKKLH